MHEINIVDFQYLYYKYKNLSLIGRLRQLEFRGKDTTMLYYPIKEIEKFSNGGEIPTCVCFDSKAKKRAESDTYKSNRKKTLDSSDIDNIAEIKDILSKVGYACYKLDGYEADDLVAKLSNMLYTDERYDKIHIYTVDKDLMQLVNDKVDVNLYRTSRGYMQVSKENFEITAEELFKTYIPFNFVKIYKCMCGDSSDNIKGIVKFGPSAFSKWLMNNVLDASKCNDCDYIKEIFASSLTSEQYKQAIESLELVEFRSDFELGEPFGSGYSINKEVYGLYGMNSFMK